MSDHQKVNYRDAILKSVKEIVRRKGKNEFEIKEKEKEKEKVSD